MYFTYSRTPWHLKLIKMKDYFNKNKKSLNYSIFPTLPHKFLKEHSKKFHPLLKTFCSTLLIVLIQRKKNMREPYKIKCLKTTITTYNLGVTNRYSTPAEIDEFAFTISAFKRYFFISFVRASNRRMMFCYDSCKKLLTPHFVTPGREGDNSKVAVTNTGKKEVKKKKFKK